jgi:hypothetical protein
MSPPSSASEPPKPSFQTRVVTLIEWLCFTALSISQVLLLPCIGLFFTYTILGSVGTSLGIWTPSYLFLSLESDPYFNVFGTMVGLVICDAAGSMILLRYMRGVNNTKEEISTLAAFASFGFGAAIVRFTCMTTIEVLQSIVL